MSPWSLRLTKAVLPDDFARRRRQLLNHMHPGSIAVIPERCNIGVTTYSFHFAKTAIFII